MMLLAQLVLKSGILRPIRSKVAPCFVSNIGVSQSRFMSQSSPLFKAPEMINYFKLFPSVFPNQGPPKDPFKINQRALRKEYLKLQADSHPDVLIGSNQLNSEVNLSEEEIIDENSKTLNKAYSTLKSPLARSQHYLLLNGIDVINDEPSSSDELGDNLEESGQGGAPLFKKIASSDTELLLLILDIHEQLESCGDYEQLKQLKKENDDRIEASENRLNEIYKQNNVDDAVVETIKLNYWFNIKNAIKEWEPGKKVHLTH